MTLFNSDEYPGNGFEFQYWDINTDGATREKYDDNMLLGSIAQLPLGGSVGHGLIAELCKRYESAIRSDFKVNTENVDDRLEGAAAQIEHILQIYGLDLVVTVDSGYDVKLQDKHTKQETEINHG